MWESAEGRVGKLEPGLQRTRKKRREKRGEEKTNEEPLDGEREQGEMEAKNTTLGKHENSPGPKRVARRRVIIYP